MSGEKRSTANAGGPVHSDLRHIGHRSAAGAAHGNGAAGAPRIAPAPAQGRTG